MSVLHSPPPLCAWTCLSPLQHCDVAGHRKRCRWGHSHYAHRLYWEAYSAGHPPLCHFVSLTVFFFFSLGFTSAPRESARRAPSILRAVSGVLVSLNKSFVLGEWAGEAMSQKGSCCRVCSRGFYSCSWKHPSEPGKVNIFCLFFEFEYILMESETACLCSFSTALYRTSVWDF